MDDLDKPVDQNPANELDTSKDLPYYLPSGQPPLTEEEIAAGIEFSPISGCARFKARPGQPMITHEEVRKMYEEDFP
jgi:hypothetical protein